jgi:AraC-like DNA-binding protein
VINVSGIDLDSDIVYKGSSLRFFEKNECHVTRVCPHDVLLLVYEGVLRFREESEEVVLYPGQYYIQKRDIYQSGDSPSDSPKYLYVHFVGEWTDGNRENVLSKSGSFDYPTFAPLIQKMDRLAHESASYIERTAVFFEILSLLRSSVENNDSAAALIRGFIEKHYLEEISLEDICRELHYSKNHVINIFRTKYGITPFEYINDVKIKRAMYLLEVTSKSIDEIAAESGFNHYSHFYRLFMRKNGISPFEWRRRVRVLL